jgi:chloride channel 3/4/5
MISLMIAKIVGGSLNVILDLFVDGGMADVLIEEKKYPFLDPRENEILGTSAAMHMTPASHLILVKAVMTYEELTNTLESNDFTGYPVITSKSDPSLVGYVSRKDLLDNLIPSLKITFTKPPDPDGLDLSRLIDRTPLSVDPRVPIEFVADLFKKLGVLRVNESHGS